MAASSKADRRRAALLILAGLAAAGWGCAFVAIHGAGGRLAEAERALTRIAAERADALRRAQAAEADTMRASARIREAGAAAPDPRRLDAEIGERTLQLAEAERRLGELRQDLDRAAARTAAALSREWDVWARAEAAREEETRLRARVEELSGLLAKRERDLAASGARLAAMRARIAAAEGEFARLTEPGAERAAEEALRAARTRLSELERREREARERLGELRLRIERGERAAGARIPAPSPRQERDPNVEDRPDGSRIIRIVPTLPGG